MILLVVFAVLAVTPVEENPFLDTPVGKVITFIFVSMFFLGGVAAGVAGIRSLARAWMDGRKWGASRIAERRRRDKVLASLTSVEGWPEGADGIKSSHQNLYTKVDDLAKEVHSLKDLIVQNIERNGTATH